MLNAFFAGILYPYTDCCSGIRRDGAGGPEVSGMNEQEGRMERGGERMNDLSS